MDDGKGKPSNIPKKTKLIFGVVALSVIGGGYWWLKEPNIEPEINPNPTEFFTIHGEFPFGSGYQLAIDSTFMASNKTYSACSKTFYAFGIIPANTTLRGLKIENPIKKHQLNKFSVKVSKDHLLPGPCNFGLDSVGYFIVKTGSKLESNLKANPLDQHNREGYFLSSAYSDWSELKHGNINISCRPNVGREELSGGVSCERLDQNEVNKYRREYKSHNKPMPTTVNLRFVIEDENVKN
ncbi:hypothetical protein UXA55_19980 [Aeromonas caviae]|uniref:hypothetical protein n=1 Tax=Aeromonas caviae TaxID=648 RepID=UPI002AB4E4A1|nr:hypothetical protein [Aeromonas caviae]MDY7831861.1 hypothetical protein [Aeromonas caviae]